MTIQWRLSLAAGIIGALLAGCSPAPTQVQKPATDSAQSREEQARLAVERLLSEAQTAAPIKAAQLKIQAANILIRLGRKEAAYSVLSDVDLNFLPPSLRFEIAQSRARAALDENNPEQALRYLEDPATADTSLSAEQSARISELRALAYRQQNNPVGEASELIGISSNAGTPEARQAVHNQTWTALQKLSAAQLLELSRQTGNSYYEQGWYELALIHKQNRTLDTRAQAMHEWNILWDSHPARTTPPQQSSAPDTEVIRAQRIAVLLPMQGKLSRAGNAIREGILAAYFNQQANGRILPELKFIDSVQVSQPGQLRELIDGQAIDLVIGPLEKTYVSALNEAKAMPVPVLALNYDQNEAAGRIYQFGLAAEDEARQAAAKAWQDGHKVMLALVPATDWGSRILGAFKEEFSRLGGTLADSITFSQQEAFSKDIGTLMATDKSAARARQIFRMSSQKIKFEERRRKDADAIFLSALPGDARQIKPILAFHYAGNLPVYATSHVYAGSADAQRDRDLNGINFVDTPWTLAATSEAKRYLSQKRTDTDSRFGRLYALGIDAFQIYPYLNQLAATDDSVVQGETGSLAINTNKRVTRELQWARFFNGSPQLLKK